ncbi:MAG TPA: trypsin-like peptidase domain-containing protein [Myxococcota bacterium]|jgi:S1-C subfamily serine protease|nr:trypsin-like peptidase domain-containing protein [Myxococcota bacterium]
MSNVAIDLSNALAAAVEAVAPSVVRVEARHRRPSSGVVWAADGTIVTAAHAVEWDEGIEVGLADGKTLPATLVGRDPGTDVAVLRAEGAGLAAATWSPPDALKVGHLVLAVGRPGRTARASSGIVSALGDAWRTPGGGRLDRYLQADVGREPGFSGGPLVDAAGRALGLGTSALMRGHWLAVPSRTLERVVASLQQHGRVRRGYLGVGTYPVRLPPAVEKQVGQPAGLLVVSVQPDGPSEKAGLGLGDVLVALDGERLGTIGDLLALLDEERVGKEATLRVLRGGQVSDVKVTVGVRP